MVGNEGGPGARPLALRGKTVVQPWRTAIDFRYRIEANSRFWDIYAPGTIENRAGHPGRYRYFLAHGWSSASLPNGRYRLEVAAFDTRGNEATSALPFAVANG